MAKVKEEKVNMPRHVFTHEERVKGGKSRFEYIMDNEPELLKWLHKKIRKFNKKKKEKEKKKK